MRDAGTEPISKQVCQAANRFTHSVLAGEFGPDDSRDSRSDAFLKQPQVVAQAVEIFLESLRIDDDGNIANQDEAERHAAELIRRHCR